MQTCTAPGHPTCTITCYDGCYASYVEPDGPCNTGCTGALGEARLGEGNRYSISVTNLSLGDVCRVFGLEPSAGIVKSDKRISFSLQSVTIGELERKIRESFVAS